MNQKSFLEKFVIKYEQAPELLKIYNQASIRRVSEDSQSDELILLPSKSKPSYWLAEICVGAARDKYIVLVCFYLNLAVYEFYRSISKDTY